MRQHLTMAAADGGALEAWAAAVPADLADETWASLTEGPLPPLAPGFVLRLQEWVDAGGGVLVVRGEVGQARDRIAAAVAHRLAALHDLEPVFIDWLGLRFELDDDGRRAAGDAAASAGVAVLLDVAAGGAGDAWERTWLEELASVRGGRPTVLTTTVAREALDLWWGEKVAVAWRHCTVTGTATR